MTMKGYGYQLSALLSNNAQASDFLQAVACADQIPERIRKRHFVVLNTAPSTSPGKHWLTVFNPNNLWIEIFDPLGADINYWKDKFPFQSDVVFNVQRLQCKDSTSCALFSVYYIVRNSTCFSSSSITFDFFSD